MKAGTYYRLCPYLSEDYNLSEIKPDKVQAMINETNEYMDRNEPFLEAIAANLLNDRYRHQLIKDHAMNFWNTHDYSLPWKTSYKRITKLSR